MGVRPTWSRSNWPDALLLVLPRRAAEFGFRDSGLGFRV